MSHRLVILGCGSSGGVPRLGPAWGACDPAEPKNRRRRCSALVERSAKGGRTSVLIDASPDLREQLLDARVEALNGVLFTHDHADHTHGIDDLRMVAYAMKKRVPVYMDDATRASLIARFQYCFETPPASSYSPILKIAGDLRPGQTIAIDGPGGAVRATTLLQQHGDIASLGFRVAGMAYSPDVSDLPEATIPLLQDLDVWVVDALRPTPHPSHFHLKRALEWIERLAPKRAILTHMTAELDYETLRRSLPANVEPAYDGMIVEF
jgi:phosphoribosyl 1,2-cyclic phosphate phosphodiesterase